VPPPRRGLARRFGARWKPRAGSLHTVSVQVLERMFAAYRARGVEGALEFMVEDFEAVIGPEMSAEPDVYRGHDGVRRYFAAFEGIEDVRLTPEEFIEDGERVLVPTVLTGRGASSGIEIEQRVVQAWQFRNGKAARVDVFTDLDRARAAGR
jgi:ketosteroid isomerase-like protein